MSKRTYLLVILAVGLLFYAGCMKENGNAAKTGHDTASVTENQVRVKSGATHTTQSQSAPDRPAPTPGEQQPALQSPAFSGEAESKAEGPIPGPAVREAEREAEGSEMVRSKPNATTGDSGRSDTASATWHR
jgi:hypothetical protein